MVGPLLIIPIMAIIQIRQNWMEGKVLIFHSVYLLGKSSFIIFEEEFNSLEHFDNDSE